MPEPAYRRVLLKLSGEVLAGDSGYWIDDFVMVYDQSARAEEYNPEIIEANVKNLDQNSVDEASDKTKIQKISKTQVEIN